ncbi:terminase TerL endonuclease subunit [Pectobacterium quasiaquaticum]|uniref:terminase TerL endonuclease subunit n=1 Tax=Pectobacterium quasiaquaticum TaxID=2774015 RepID=UPI001CF76F4E|nr:terminase TerL endonuclease subunit [Pectobacterium quasiaquaticum]
MTNTLDHNGDPVLAWTMSNVVMETDATQTLSRTRINLPTSKIDPAVAFLMSFGTWQAEHEDFAFDMSESHKERLAVFDGV